MTIGPVEYLILEFPGSEFTGRVAPALADLVRNGTIRILDLVFISKNEDGDVNAVEYDEIEDLLPFGDVDGEVGGLIGLDDIQYVGQTMHANSSVALLIWEDMWAAPLADALRDANGVVMEGGRIPHDLIESAMSELAAVG
jgi:hypothetical protein